MVAKIGTNADCISCWPNFYPMQVAFYLAREITQVLDAIPWVRCASGNVFISLSQFFQFFGLTWPWGLEFVH